ncbi:MAG TPA: mechanosensitive ion channel [Candidatus Sumerlaeota bacterium]|nr:MAG: Low conductance mechanosensitive channel YnaI [candidate division BRC1 bacterium ADurb.Bin183]HOE63735.1 mechanosensitive ion channel [Candidatus Sumerlaeota bacterium]HRR31658.1 mechanosensitive ion channel [Candidatus Sumerlaeia bacterium]HON49500.1 mechanosensitive ion channel [Candidatus Sumerlaeota bacterium]HOR64649.1 mechanosensitive ion channel [Candidatus Sumerlaeota bacterium]
METIVKILEIRLWRESYIYNLLMAVFVVCVSVLAGKILSLFFKRWMLSLERRFHVEMEERVISKLARPLIFILFLIGVRFAGSLLNLPTPRGNEAFFDVREFFNKTADVIIILSFIWIFLNAVDGAQHLLERLARQPDARVRDQLLPIFTRIVKVVIVIVGVIMIISRMGQDVKAIVAGLGIGGVALALAAQETLKNLFGSIMILVDKPFQVGDWITAGNTEGVVEDIGFRSTRIRTFPDTLVTIPNSKMADAEINNFSRMHKRRVAMTIGVSYAADADRMEKCLSGIKKILDNHEGVTSEGQNIHFLDFGESSLNIRVLYFTKDLTYSGHNKVRQEVNLAIMRMLEEAGLSIALPSRSIYIEKTPPASNGSKS